MRRLIFPMLATILVLVGVGTAFGQTSVVRGGLISGGASSTATSTVKGIVLGGPAGSASATSRLQGGLLATLQPPATLQLIPAGPAAAGTAAPIGVATAADPSAVVEIYYRLGGETAFRTPVEMVAVGGGEYSVDIPAGNVGIRGLEFYVKAVQFGATTHLPPGGPADTPLRHRVIMTDHALPALPDAAYRMVAFPLEADPATVAGVFQDDLGAPNERQWRLARWPGGTNVDYLEYGAVGNVTPGRSYWLARRGAAAVDASGTSMVPPDLDGGVPGLRIQLVPGWNQIGNPFAFEIDWLGSNADESADIGDALYDYVGGATNYNDVDRLAPYRGYWVENTSQANQDLFLPYVDANAKARPILAEPKAATTEDWSLRLELAAGERVDRLLRIGARRGALEDRDALDCGTPPDPVEGVLSLASLVGVDKAPDRLAADWREPGREGWYFRLLARGEGGLADLRVVDPVGLPAGFALAVYDPATDRKFAWDPATGFALPQRLELAGDEYVLLVGHKAWVDEQEGVPTVMPTAYDMHQNYPNPFNPETIIAFDLPRPDHVKLEIYDPRGRRVAVLRNEPYPGGRHQVKWSGRDDRGARVASGVYLYRLETGSFVKTRRMLLLK